MRRVALFVAACVVVSAIGLYAQQPDSSASINNPLEVSQSVPRLIMFSGTLKDLTGKPLTGPVDLNFAIYKEQADAAPLWQESQTLNVDEQGHYTALLGAMQPEGLPVDLFTSGEARWLGVSAGKLPEQPRVLLVSVPYALKANDAEMLGGKPASAYALAPPAGASTSAGAATAGATAPGGAAASELAAPGNPKSGPKPNVVGTGTQNYIPLWTDSAGTLGNSVMYQSSGLVGVGTATPGVALDVYGASAGLRLSGTGTHQVTITGATSGRLGQDAAGFFFSSDSNGAALRFGTNNGSGHEWMRITSAGLVGIGTTTPAQRLDVAGNINASGSLTAASFTGNGAGLTALTPANISSGTAGINISGNAASATTAGGLSCTGCVGNTQLGVNYAGSASQGGAAANALLLNGLASSAFQAAGSYATLGANTFTADQTLNAALNLAGTTGPDVGVINGGGHSFIHACCPKSLQNTFVGTLAGNFTADASSSDNGGGLNTGIGYQALQALTSGWGNTASGYTALYANTTGVYNTADGFNALNHNTTGGNNTASGAGTLAANITGNSNTASGAGALAANTGNYNTASGADALDFNTTGSYNTASGFDALYTNTTGSSNVAIGRGAGGNLGSGSSNIMVGAFAGSSLDSNESNNIDIGNSGAVLESGVIRIGTSGTQTRTYIAGITGVTPGGGSPLPVIIDGNGQLGTGTFFTGTVTSVGSGAGLTGGPITTSGTLSLASAACAAGQAAVALPLTCSQFATLGANTFTADQTLNTALNLAATTGADVGVINGGGYSFIHACCPKSAGNTFVGTLAGNFTADASASKQSNGHDTAIGFQALQALTSGYWDTASGYQALYSNTSGSGNTANGWSALYHNTSGGANTAYGSQSLVSNSTGLGNTATGVAALFSNTTGNYNTADGGDAGSNLTSGSSNIMVGDWAGINLISNESNNIDIGNGGAASESGVIRIGTDSSQDSSCGVGNHPVCQVATYIAAIRGVTPGGASPLPVIIDARGQLGTFAGAVGTVTSVTAGAGLTASPSNPITTTGTLSLTSASCNSGYAVTALPGPNCQQFAGLGSNTFSGTQTVTGTVSATSFSGSGSSLTNLSASNLSGSVPNSAISGIYSNAVTFSNGTFSGTWSGGFSATVSSGNAVYGNSNSGVGVFAESATNDGLLAESASGPAAVVGLSLGTAKAGSFTGDVSVSGTLTAGTKDFLVDHPLDPANRYLYHASVESSEMINIYAGNVTLDGKGEGVVELPEWFEAENADFRYQLTAIGAPAPGLYIAAEISNHQFRIAGGNPGLKVSWQVTGVRQDAYAKAHPLHVEVDKPEKERGYYIHPELYGAPPEKSIDWARQPELMKRLKDEQGKVTGGGMPGAK